jgi:hypothetical protein
VTWSTHLARLLRVRALVLPPLHHSHAAIGPIALPERLSRIPHGPAVTGFGILPAQLKVRV